jgi:hypothetical protein
MKALTRIVLLYVVGLAISPPARALTQAGYTLHFNFLHTPSEARQTVALAARAGASVVSVDPPAHIWEDPVSLSGLDALFREATNHRMGVILSRMDACQADGSDWLFSHSLTRPGRLPDGSATSDLFRATVGNHAFERWQLQETAYYAKRYGRARCLRAAAVGGMVEPFVSERGSLLDWSRAANSYEIAQYTPDALAEWRRWLRRRFHSIYAVNRAYGAVFSGFTNVPMPRNNKDTRFKRPHEAYFDLAQCLNDWVMDQYEANRRCWRRCSRAPFLLQMCGYDMERISRGYPEFAAFDLPSWLQAADGIGLSLYTYAFYLDWGHATDMAMIRLISGARALGKPVYIMESGCEAPDVTLKAHELSFVTRLGLQLTPRAQIYEYFRYARGDANAGMMVSPKGDIRQPGFNTVSGLMAQVPKIRVTDQAPCFYYLSLPPAARANTAAGYFNRTLYELAGDVPCRFLPWKCFKSMPRGTIALLPPGLQNVLRPLEMSAFLKGALKERWILVSDKATCRYLSAVSPRASVVPIANDDWLRAKWVEESAADLLEALRTIPAFQRRIKEQLIEPRPGVYWLQTGCRLRLWVDDAEPVVFQRQALRNARISLVWCSNSKPGFRQPVKWRDGKGQDMTDSLACGQWLPIPGNAGRS